MSAPKRKRDRHMPAEGAIMPATPGSDWTFGSGGFAKLYGDRLAQSSLLETSLATRWVFVFILAQADAEGRYRCATVQGLARAANVTPAQATKAVAELTAPDPESTSKTEGGRRIVPIPGGWQIVNYLAYRSYQTSEQRAAAARMRKLREGK